MLFNKMKTESRIAALTMAAVVIATIPGMSVHAEEVTSVYTGEQVSAEQAMQRPIAVMMPTDKAAQPSYGISHAKVLYEIMEEGNISRQLAVIDDWQDLDKIGNVRSCRAYYIPIATEWDPILIHVGGVHYMKNRITAPDINNISGAREYGVGGEAPGSGSFFRTTDRKAPHNAYISANGIIKAAESLGYSLNTREQYYNAKHFEFAEQENTLEQYGEAAQTAENIDLSKIFPYTGSSFAYHAEDGLYYKNIHGKAQTDGLNGEQLAFANVIIQNTKWSKLDAKGYLSFQDIDDTEDGYYFTKGKYIHVNWKKSSDYEPTRYYDDQGNEIQLNVGKTYIAVAQKDRSAIIK